MEFNCNGIMVDTGFLIRLVNKDKKLNSNAKKFYKYFLDKEISVYVSTISLAEFCVRGKLIELPLRDGLKIISFNAFHAKKQVN